MALQKRLQLDVQAHLCPSELSGRERRFSLALTDRKPFLHLGVFRFQRSAQGRKPRDGAVAGLEPHLSVDIRMVSVCKVYLPTCVYSLTKHACFSRTSVMIIPIAAHGSDAIRARADSTSPAASRSHKQSSGSHGSSSRYSPSCSLRLSVSAIQYRISAFSRSVSDSSIGGMEQMELQPDSRPAHRLQQQF